MYICIWKQTKIGIGHHPYDIYISEAQIQIKSNFSISFACAIVTGECNGTSRRG